MPVIPTYKPDQVSLRPLDTTPRQDLPVGAFGLEIGKATQGFGQALDRAADAAERIEDMRAETYARESDMSISTFNLQKQTELAGMKGMDYYEHAPAKLKEIEDYGKTLVAKARNGLERRMINDVVTRRTNAARVAVEDRRVKELDFADTASREAVIAHNINLTGAAYTTPEYAAHRAELEDSIRGRLEKDGIRDPQVVKVELNKKLNKVHYTGIGGMIESGLYEDASTRIADAEAMGEIEPETALALRKTLRENTDIYGAKAAADAVLGTGAAFETGAMPTGTEAQRVTRIGREMGRSEEDIRDMIVQDLIESGGRARPPDNGSSGGKFQFQPSTWAQYSKPGEDRYDPNDSTRGAFRLQQDNKAKLTRLLGRKPQAWEIYLMHQQGAGGGPALFSAPRDMNAVQALLPAYKGNERLARLAVTGNGGTANGTVGDFLDMWRGKVARKLQGVASRVQAGGGEDGGTNPLPGREAFVAQVVAMAPDRSPKTVAAYRQQAEARYADLKSAQTEQERVAVDAVQPYLRDPNIRTVDQLISANPKAWAALPETTKTTIHNHFASGEAAGPYAKQSDPEVLQALNAMQRNNPEKFVGLDMTPYIGQLSPTHYKAYLDDKEALHKGQGEAKRTTLSNIHGISSTLLKSVGIDPGSKDEKVAKRAAMFEAAMMRGVDHYRKLTGKEPDDTALHTIADQLLISGSYDANGPGWFGNTKVRAFEVPVGRGQDFQYEVPKKTREQIKAAFVKRNGQAPSEAQLQADYRRMRAAGIYP